MLSPICWRMIIILSVSLTEYYKLSKLNNVKKDHMTTFASFVKLNRRQRKKTTLHSSSFSLLKVNSSS